MDDKVKSLKPLPPSLPATREDFLAARQIKAERTLNDYIEDLYLELAENDNFKRLIWAVWDEQALEGSLAADNIMAAEMIRDRARENSHPYVSNEKLATISKSLGVVQRRYGLSRKQRRNMVGGEEVPGDNGD